MKKLLLAGLAIGAAVATLSPANAADGCGPGYHRNAYGHCHPNRPMMAREVVVAPGGLVIGNYYRGRGYWDGHRYWHHRYRWHNEWRYR